MAEVKGRVRVLPPDTPGLPPRAFPKGTRPANFIQLWCGQSLPVDETPDLPHQEKDVSWVCTRKPHDLNEIHVCDFDSNGVTPHVLIVWGGE